MQSSTQVEEDADLSAAKEMIEEFVSLRASRWKAKQFKIPAKHAVKIAAMCWDLSTFLAMGPGCLLPNVLGGYVFIPYDDSTDGLPPDLLERFEKLGRWIKDRKNRPTIFQMDTLLEKYVDEMCFWEFLDGGDASRVDFHGKIKLLARHRVSKGGFEVVPSKPLHAQFGFVIGVVTESGRIKKEWRCLDWGCTENEVARALDAFPRDQYPLQRVADRQVRVLESIHGPEAKEAQDLIQKLRSQEPIKDGSEWSYFLCDADKDKICCEAHQWITLRQPNDVKLMKRLAMERSTWPTIVRRCHIRHYEAALKIAKLQYLQRLHVQLVETAALEGNGKTGSNAPMEASHQAVG